MTDIYWLTGQPGAGKTALGTELLAFLTEKNPGIKCVLLDGDDIRAIFENNDYSVAGRQKNVELVQNLSAFFVKNNIVPIVCMVSPFLEQREKFKEKFSVKEIYVYCSETRGREHFHVDYYQKPETDFTAIDTTGKGVASSFRELLKLL